MPNWEKGNQNMISKAGVKKLEKAIHKMNQRLLQIEKSFGGKESAVYKNAVSSIKSADLEKFVSKNDRIVASKIIKAIKDGKAEGEVERLINMAGYKISKNGHLLQTAKGARIPTVTEMKQQYIKDYGKPEEGVNIYDEINEIQEIGNDLHDLLYEIQEGLGTAGGTEIIEQYFPEVMGKGKRGDLTYSQVEQIKRKARKMIYEDEGLRNANKAERNKAAEEAAKFADKSITNGSLKN